ncbi:MAG: hypothetical protein V2A73_14610 [Pseudomonadota bacterium]
MSANSTGASEKRSATAAIPSTRPNTAAQRTLATARQPIGVAIARRAALVFLLAMAIGGSSTVRAGSRSKDEAVSPSPSPSAIEVEVGDARQVQPVVVVGRQLVLEGQARPALVAGMLSRSLAGTPVEAVRAYLESGPDPIRGFHAADFRHDQTIRARGGALVKMKQTYGGVDVVGAGVAVRLDEQGRVRWVGSSAAAIPPAFSVSPGISREDAGRLVIHRSGGNRFRLAWELIVRNPVAAWEIWRVFVDAEDGTVLAADNLALRDRLANVYECNPVTTPRLEEVVLDLPYQSTVLDGDRVFGLSCVDNHTCTEMGPRWVRVCEYVQNARADESGDFNQYYPPRDPLDGSDVFAEVQGYYHATKAFAFFESFAGGDPIPRSTMLAVIANYSIPDMNDPFCDGPESEDDLAPFDSAFFAPSYGRGSDGVDSIYLGQGSVVDFAYDGDVVYHEFTHAVMWSQSEIFAIALQHDSYGVDPTPGGLNEGFPDYFSSVLAESAAVGEYAGQTFPEQGMIRNLDNSETCPTGIWGESHMDSLMWSGALWEVRSALPVQQRQPMDRAVYTTMASLGAYDSFETAQAKLVAELEVTIGAEVADLAESVFRRRGLDGCNRRVIDVKEMGEDPLGHPLALTLDMDPMTGATFALPSPVQFKLTIPVDASEITFRVDEVTTSAGLGAPTALQLIGKKGSEPIVWQWDGRLYSFDATAVVALASSGVGYSGSLVGDFPAGEYHLQLVNQGTTPSLLSGLSFGYAPVVPQIDAGTNAAPDSGCDCRLGGQPTSDGAIGASVAILFALAIRRVLPRWPACRGAPSRRRRRLRGPSTRG